MKRQQDETATEPLLLPSLNSHHEKQPETDDSSKAHPSQNPHPQAPCAAVRVNEAAWDSLVAGMLDACPRKRLRGRPRRDGLPPQPRPKTPHPPTALLNHFVLPPRSPPAFLTLPTPDIGPATLLRPSWVPSNPPLSQSPIRRPSANPSESHPAAKQRREERPEQAERLMTMISAPSLTSPFPSPTQPTSFSSSFSAASSSLSLSLSSSSSSSQSRLQVMQIPFLLNAAPLTN